MTQELQMQAGTNLLETEQKQSSDLSKRANSTDEEIKRSLSNNIRKMERVALLGEITKEIEFVAENYCGARINDDDFDNVVSESYRFIKDRFAHLTTTEIRIAFRLAASQTINANIKAYYGKFTIAMLGEVLSAYDEYRKPKLIQFAKESEIKKVPDPTEIEQQQTARIERVREIIKDLSEESAMIHVSVSDYEVLEKKGLINLNKDQKWKLMEDAKPLYRKELEDRKLRCSSFQRNDLQKAINDLMMDEKSQQKNLAVRAQRLAVVRHLQNKLSTN